MNDNDRSALQQLCEQIINEDLPPVLEKYQKYIYLRVRKAPQHQFELFISPAGRAVFKLEKRRNGAIDIVRHASTERSNSETGLVHQAEGHMASRIQADLAARAARRIDRKTAVALLGKPAFGGKDQPSPQRTLLQEAQAMVRRIMAPDGGEDKESPAQAHRDAVGILTNEFFNQDASALLNSFNAQGGSYVANHNNVLRSLQPLQAALKTREPAGLIFAEEMMHLPALDISIQSTDQLKRAAERYTGLSRAQMQVLARDPAGYQDWEPEPESLLPGPLPTANVRRRTEAVAACQALLEAEAEEERQRETPLPTGIIGVIGPTCRTLAEKKGEGRSQWLAVLREFLKQAENATRPGTRPPPTMAALETIGQGIIAGQDLGLQWQQGPLERMVEQARAALNQHRGATSRQTRTR